MSEQLYRLPFGGSTPDRDEYGKAWKTLGEKAEKFFPGYEWTAFDPMVRMDRKDRYEDKSFKSTYFDLTPDAVAALQTPLPDPCMACKGVESHERGCVYSLATYLCPETND